MKKTAIAMLALTVGIVAASCQKEAEPEIKSFEPMTINAVSEGIGTATKTEMIYKYDIAWSADDKIYVTDGTSNDTFTLSAGKGTTKGTFKQDGEVTFTNEVQAYYPATMVQEDGSLVWPAVQSNNQTVPMYSTKTVSGKVEDFNFTSLGAMLQIVFTTPQSDVTLRSIEIKDGTETMSGAFTVDTDGKANITATDKAGITLNLGDGVSVSNKIAYFNIAVPAGNYQDLTLIFTATDRTKCIMTGGKVNIAYNTVGRLTLTGKEFKIPGGLSGVFTVGPNATDKVHFSKGNLYYDGSKFNFEANQYDFRTYAGKNSCINGASSTTGTPTGHWGLFGWVGASSSFTGDAQYGVSTSTTVSDYGNVASEALKSDWGNTIDNSGTWRTLSRAEWHYLFNNHVKVWGQCNSVNGYFIAPDGFVGDASTLSSLVSDWTAAEAAGIVFLPAAGYRNGSSVNCVGDRGFYWSSAAYGGNVAYGVYFNSDDVYPDDYDGRLYGYSVRLITDVTE